MSTVHRITGDGEADNGLGCCAMTWDYLVFSSGVYVGASSRGAAAQYIENPHNDTDVSDLPTYRSDTIDLRTISDPTVATVVGTTVTFDVSGLAYILPTATVREGTALVDSAGEVFYVTAEIDESSCIVDRAGMATGALLGFYPTTPRTITYGISTEGFPIVEKFYEQGWANFQLLRGGRDFDVVTRSYAAEDATITTQTVTYDTDLTSRLYDDREYQRRLLIPREQSRAIGLQVSIVMGDPICYWQIGAMAYTFRPYSDRTEARR